MVLNRMSDTVESISVRVGKRIWDIRNARGWTRNYLSELTGINANYLGRIEHGEVSTSLENLESIALALQIPLTSFFQFNNEHHRSILLQSLSSQMDRLSDDALENIVPLLAMLPSQEE